MHIGVNAWRLSGKKFGVVRYIEYLLKHWTYQISESDKLTLFVSDRIDNSWGAENPAIQQEIISPRLSNALWENLFLPSRARKTDVLFGPSYTLPLACRCRSAVAIHSVNEANEGTYSLKYNLTYGLKYKLSCKVADVVIANSYSTKERIRDYYGIPDEKIEVVWLGVDDKFQWFDDEAQNTATRQAYFGDDRPYILMVGSLSYRRNIPALIQAFGIIRKKMDLPHRLFLVGVNHDGLPLDELVRQAGIEDAFKQINGDFGSHDELAAIYNAADMYVLPSLTEGFSLTLAEAMACGVPVITSSASSLGEVANGYGYTIERPDDVEQLANAMEDLISSNELLAQFRDKGLVRARELRWDVTAQKTLDILRTLAA